MAGTSGLPPTSVAYGSWRLANPLVGAFAGVLPWWVVLETRGRRSGEPRRVPLAKGPVDGGTAWLLAVHGEHAAYARNIAADPRVMVRIDGCWRRGRAALMPLDDGARRRSNLYARLGLRASEIDPRMIWIDLE